MKNIRWVSRGAPVVVTLELDEQALWWLSDNLPRTDDSTIELQRVLADIQRASEPGGDRHGND